ncbi:MAG: hypothetical protein ACRDQ1_11330, partial [Sciscionella sp.]
MLLAAVALSRPLSLSVQAPFGRSVAGGVLGGVLLPILASVLAVAVVVVVGVVRVRLHRKRKGPEFVPEEHQPRGSGTVFVALVLVLLGVGWGMYLLVTRVPRLPVQQGVPPMLTGPSPGGVAATGAGSTSVLALVVAVCCVVALAALAGWLWHRGHFGRGAAVPERRDVATERSAIYQALRAIDQPRSPRSAVISAYAAME